MYQELSKEISALGKDDSLLKNGDVMKELNDVFSGMASNNGSVKLTQAEKKLRRGSAAIKKEPLN